MFQKRLITTYLAYIHLVDNVDTILWSLIELTCIVICGSLPSLRPWADKLIPSIETIERAICGGARSKSRTNTISSKSGNITNKGRFQGYYEDKDSRTPTSDLYPLKPLHFTDTWAEPYHKSDFPSCFHG